MEEIIETTENEVMDVVAGAALYKFVVTPLIAKIKARKAAKSEEAESNDVVIEEVDEPSDKTDDE